MLHLLIVAELERIIKKNIYIKFGATTAKIS